jgi:mono/diheme cytochrome c family protein
MPNLVRLTIALALSVLLLAGESRAFAVESAGQERRAQQVTALFRQRCVKCHGPLRPKQGLNLSTLRGVARGGKSGAAVVPGRPDKSLLWKQLETDEMPPKSPLSSDDKAIVREWIAAGASGMPTGDLGVPVGADHWAFQKLRKPEPPAVQAVDRVRTDVDRLLLAKLERRGLSFGPDADRATLVRRVCFDLTGLPPTPDDIGQFVKDPAPDAYERMVERYLASPRYGERWGQYWLDAAGYADSSGYFSNERDRPLAYRYRDFVIESFNRDEPFDQFVREQLAGDELVDFKPDVDASPDVLRSLIATHYLSNAPDGTDQSAAQPEAMRIDRYAALEGTQQVVASSLLGLTLKCSRCHDHKFEPITQREYYSIQSIFVPALNPVDWVPPLQRTVRVPTPGDLEIWLAQVAEFDKKLAAMRAEGESVTRSILARRAVAQKLSGDAMDWTPNAVGDWISATFRLVANGGKPDTRIEYRIAITDKHGLKISGNPAGVAKVYADATEIARLGEAPYTPGHFYGVRVTNIGGGKYRLDHLVDFVRDGRSAFLDAALLADGSFEVVRREGLAVDELQVESGHAAAPAETAIAVASSEGSAKGKTLFVDGSEPVSANWTSSAPPDAEMEAVVLDAEAAERHCALRKGTALRVLARSQFESLIATKKQFDWTPDEPGQSIQATFDLVDDRTEAGGTLTAPAAYFGYVIGARDSFHRQDKQTGNVLIDGNTQGSPNAYFEYPGSAARKLPFGSAIYGPGRNCGVRVTNVGGGMFNLIHLVDGIPDGPPLAVPAADLPDGGFGLYFGAARSFVVDHVTVRVGKFSDVLTPAQQLEVDLRRRLQIDREIKQLESQRPARAGTEVAWVSDRSATPPKVFVLKRGAYGANAEEVQPAGLAMLTDADNAYTISPPNAHSTGRRLAFARWLTKPGSRPAALLARVQADRVWRKHFGRGLVPTADNFGLSGSPPTHPELLEHLAATLVESGWSIKRLHREILLSTAYRQSSLARPDALAADQDDALYWCFPMRRLDAEAIRDSMLAVSGELDVHGGGPAVPIERYGSEQEKQRGALNREIVVSEHAPGAHRRSIYLEHRRTQIPTTLALFGTPSISLNCVERSSATVPLQSLAQLNSEFVRVRARATAERLLREAGDEPPAQVTLAFRLALGRAPMADELADARSFIAGQQSEYFAEESPTKTALADFCQMLFASNPFLYVE